MCEKAASRVFDLDDARSIRSLYGGNMKDVRAIGFDLFNTLLTVAPVAMDEAAERLVGTLHEEGVAVEASAFARAYVDSARHFIRQARADGRETHNRFWVAGALRDLGYELEPGHPAIGRAIEAYFSAFTPNCSLLPLTRETLEQLSQRYRLGLLSNFTDGPAAREILDTLDLPRYFQVVLISGEFGYRKPHPAIFEAFVEQLGVPAEETLFVGDDLQADMDGARQAGLQPVLTTAVQDTGIPNAQTVLSPVVVEPPQGLLRISCWQDLIDMLEA